MKLRNLLIALTTVGTFMACSNNDDPVTPVIPEGEGIATLSVKIAELQTKSLGGEGDVTNATVKDLCVLIFKGTGGDAILEKIGRSEGGTKVVDIPVTSGNKKVIVLANLSERLLELIEGENETSYEEALGRLETAFDENEQNGTLSMNSKTYDVTLSVGKKNYLGYSDGEVTESDSEAFVTTSSGDEKTPVKLYRNVAEVTLANVALEENPLYPDAQLTLREVFILHGEKMSSLVGEEGAEWGSTYRGFSHLNGSGNEEYKAWVEKMSGKQKAFEYLEGNYEPYLEKVNTYRDSYTVGEATLGKDKIWQSGYSRSFYVYENENVEKNGIHTLLVVKANYSYQGGNGVRVTKEDRYYTIAVGITGAPEGGFDLPEAMKGLGRSEDGKFLGVLRNLSYNVSMTIAGPGSETPFDREYSANISASVKVDEWNVVKVPAEVN